MRLVYTRRGMTTLQAVLLLGAAFVVVWGLMAAWKAAEKPLAEQAERTLAGEAGDGAAKPPSGGGGDPPPDADRPLFEGGTTAPPKPDSLDGVTPPTDTGRVTSRPDEGDGADEVVSPAEMDRNRNTIAAAVFASPHGIAVVGGDHSSGPSLIDVAAWLSGEGLDHVAIAYWDGTQIRMLEMLPGDSGNPVTDNLGKPGSGPRSLDEFVGGYDTVTAVPMGGVTSAQAAAFIRELTAITAAGENYGFLDGEVCSTAIATALTRAGIPHQLDPSSLGVNDLVPRSVIEEFERMRIAARPER
jgi:hypothetical protein